MPPLPRWITHSASFAVGGLVAATICLQKERFTSDYKQQLDDGSNNNTTIKHQGYIATNRECAVKLPIHTYKPNENMTIVFDTRTKNPVFVIERLSKSNIHASSSSSSSVSSSSSRNNKRFHEEQTLPNHHRSRNSHYRNSGYDRGHLAPAADFSSAFITSSSSNDNNDEDVVDKKINDTFTLTNISPQLPQFNRLVWLRLEEFVRRVATKEECDSDDSDKKIETWIITGPLWLPTSTTTTSVDSDNGRKNNVKYVYTYEGIGHPPSLVSVPTHFFKVVLVVEKKKKQQQSTSVSINALQQTDSSLDDDLQQQLIVKKFGAFVLPHSDHDENSKGKRHIRLVDYLVRLTDLEAVTGLDFFPIIGEAEKDGDTITMNNTSSSSSIISKEVADALTDDIRYHTTKSKPKMIDKSKGDNQQDPNDTHNSSLVSSSSLLSNTNNIGGLSKNRRRRKIKEILQKNNKSTIPIQHLCRNNNDCYKLLRV